MFTDQSVLRKWELMELGLGPWPLTAGSSLALCMWGHRGWQFRMGNSPALGGRSYLSLHRMYRPSLINVGALLCLL